MKMSRIYMRYFSDNTGKSKGMSFECDEQGNIVQNLNPVAKENLRKCLAGEYNVTDRGVQNYCIGSRKRKNSLIKVK